MEFVTKIMAYFNIYLTPLRDEKLPIFFRDFVNKKQLIEEFMFLGLRKFSGVSRIDYGKIWKFYG